ncbi:MAG: InlB B-repeat-containing protein [Paludibacteraceae bacterium]|nr:InlB B-repeat-containing protein [Paludibacteraceae bacterium]
MKKNLLLFSLLSLLCLSLPQFVSAQLNEYTTIEGSTTIYIQTTGTVSDFPDLWYSLDGGDWIQVTQGGTRIDVQGYSYSHPLTGYVRFKGNNPTGFNHSSTDYVSIAVKGGNPALKGNVMSLIGGDNFSQLTTIPCDYCFYALFCPSGPASFTSSISFASTGACSNLKNAKDFVLPATELKAYCYAYMFALNSGLADAPALPATVMKPWCYAHMFDYCINSFCGKSSGAAIPALPAQELAEGCYAYMFSRCGSLYNDNENYYILPAEELAPKCYMGMFSLYGGISGGTSLKYVEIMATSLKDRCGEDITNCCAYMFNNAIWAGTTNGRQSMTLRMYWTDWGNSTTGPNNADASANAPTYGWFYGYVRYGNTFLYQDGLTPITKNSKYGTTYYNHTFPQNATLTATNYTYLTFDCKTNGGTWEQGCEYNADLRRVVRSDYKAKTVPAAPVKAGETFKGWYTQPAGGTKVEEATILNQTTAQTYYAQFGDGDDNGGDNPQDGDDTDLSNIKMSRGVLDMPTYYSFAIWGENKNVTVRLHFNTYLTTNNTNYLNNLTYDIANSYIQPAGGEKRQIASASQAKVEYLGDAYRAAHLTAKVTDTDGNDYNIDIFTNEELNAATYEDVIGTNYKSIVETSWRTCNPFHIYGTQNNEMDRLIYRNVNGRHILYTYHMDGGVNLYYEVLHVQIELFPDASKPGNIPTGIYPINATQETGTAFIGRCPSDILIYEQNQRQPYCGSFVQYELQATESDYYPSRDVWTLRDGYVEVVNVDEKYWVHVHAYADAHRTTGEDCAVIDYTACLDEDENGNTYTINTSNVTLAAQTEDGTSLTGAVNAKIANTTSWTDVTFTEGTYTFFVGNTLTLNANKSGYTFSHWLINGTRVDGNDIDYTLTGEAANIVAVFTGDGGDNPDNPDDGDNTEIVSEDANVSVYQNVSKTTTKILYNLDLRQGKDGLWYKPTDMGYGIAWADRNVGAASVSATGDYYNWSKTEPGPLPLNSTGYSGGSVYVGFILPAANDVATVKMGKDWHTPSYDEWNVLLTIAKQGNNRLNNPDDESLYIPTPPTGYYDYYTQYGGLTPVNPWLNNAGSAFLWTSEVLQLNAGDLNTTNIGMATNVFDGNVELTVGYIHLAAPVRAVYTPPFTTHTLTIHVGNYDYHYVCQHGQKVTVTAIATKEGSEFIRWEEDGLTDAVRTFTVNADMTYTAIFTENDTPDNPETPEMSPDAEVNVYQSVTKSTMKILYDLSPKQGNDGLWYTPVDLGYGVAWADRNVGASSPNAIGDYFRWGDPVAGTSFSSDHQRNLDVTGYQTYDRLTDTQDAAIVNMGNKWRMPDEEDFYQLKEQAVITNNNTFTNKDDNSLSILLPAGGYKGSKLYDQGYQYYWSRQYSNYGRNDCSSGMGYSYEEHSCFALVRSAADNKYYVNNKDKDDCFGNEPYLGMPVRALYVPPFEVCTLTINVEGYQYVYLCQLGQNVTVTAVANEGYEFDRWTEDGNTEAVRTFSVTSNMTYTATFKQAKQEYNIIYKDKGGAAFSGTHASGYPTIHTYGTATALKSATKEGYNFLGWFTDINCTGTAVTSLGATTYTSDITLYAAWEDVKPDEPDDPVNDDELHIILYEDKDADYYTDFSNKYNGKRATTVTYNRQFEQSKWSTMCLPMNVNTAILTTMKMTTRVYEFKYTKGDEESGLTLYFAQAKTLEAGKGYIVNANATLAQKTQFVFPNVVINTEADINSGFDLTNLEGYNTQGNVYLVGTLRTGLLVGSQTGNRYMGLKNNKIYYPNAEEGTNLRAYRGIFRSSVDINAQKVRIVVEGEDGEQVSELEVVNGELQERADTRKFIRNGILYIERNGRLYTAQGAVVE